MFKSAQKLSLNFYLVRRKFNSKILKQGERP